MAHIIVKLPELQESSDFVPRRHRVGRGLGVVVVSGGGAAVEQLTQWPSAVDLLGQQPRALVRFSHS